MTKINAPRIWWHLLILLLAGGLSACGGGGGGGAGQVVSADITAPEVSLGAVATPTALATQQLSGIVEPGSVVTVELLPTGSRGQATVTGGSWTYLLNDLRQGTNSVSIVATDAAGNQSPALIASIVRDTLAPVLSLNTPPVRIRTGQLLLQGEVNETATILVTNTSGPGLVLGPVSYPTATSWQLQVTGMAEGSHQFTISATDGVGNPATIVATVVQDSVAPSLVPGQAFPADGSTDVNILQPISFTFSEAMEPASLTTAGPTPTVTVVDDLVTDDLPFVPGVVTSSDGLTFTFTPEENYASDSDVQVTVTTGATDLAGNPLVAPVNWHFRTDNQPPPPPQ